MHNRKKRKLQCSEDRACPLETWTIAFPSTLVCPHRARGCCGTESWHGQPSGKHLPPSLLSLFLCISQGVPLFGGWTEGKVSFLFKRKSLEQLLTKKATAQAFKRQDFHERYGKSKDISWVMQNFSNNLKVFQMMQESFLNYSDMHRPQRKFQCKSTVFLIACIFFKCILESTT